MLMFVAMLLLGLLAVIWGFLMSFLPSKWDRLTGLISIADFKSEPVHRHLIVKIGRESREWHCGPSNLCRRILV